MRSLIFILSLSVSSLALLGCTVEEDDGGGGNEGGDGGGNTGGDGGGGSSGNGGNAGDGGGGDGGGGTALITGFEDCTTAATAPACRCNPFDSSACDDGQATCVLTLIIDPSTGVEVDIAALDGSDGASAECISNSIQTDGEGDSCFRTIGGVDRVRGSCSAGLDCDRESGNFCVPYCTQDSECTEVTCNFYDLDSEEVQNVGRCTVTPD